MEITYLCRSAREYFCHLAGAYDCRYMQILSDWVSREYGGLSGVCRSQLSYSGIHKHLLKRSAGASELDTIRGGGKRTSHTEEWDVRKDVDH